MIAGERLLTPDAFFIQTTFVLMDAGDLKSVIVQKIGLKPEMHKLLFRGKEKDDDEGLQPAGVKDNSKVLLVEDISCTEKSPDYKETRVISRGSAAVAEVTEEVDKLSEKVRYNF